MRKKKVTGKSGQSWLVTVLILFAACLILACSSLFMAERLFEASLNHDYVHYISIQNEKKHMEFPYDDGIYRKDIGNACTAVKTVISAENFGGQYS